MALAAYSELVDEIGAFLDRDDLTARIPTFIRLFEARMNRVLSDPDMTVTSTTSTSAGQEGYALPSDFLTMRAVHLNTDPKVVLESMTPAVLRSCYADSSTGKPQAYALIGENLVLGPAPDGVYALALVYQASVSGLSSANTTNWLLANHPDAYLYGALCMAQAFLQDDPRLAVWKDAWDQAVVEIREFSRRKMSPASPLQMRPTVFE